jgi:hypothetical protein
MMAVWVDVDEAGEDGGSVSVTGVKEAAETVVAVPWETVKDAEPFCASATWNIKAAGMIKNLNGMLVKL